MIEEFECGCIVDFSKDRSKGYCIKLCEEDSQDEDDSQEEEFVCGDCGVSYQVEDRNNFDCPNCEDSQDEE